MSTQNGVQPDAVRAQLNRILMSPGLAGSPRLTRLLRYLVEQALAGKAGDIKEYSVGLEVFDRPPSFDPKTDSIVRASARKLRAKLDEYYQNGGAADPVAIAIPKGGYVPEFRSLTRKSKRRIWPAAAAAVLILTALNALGWRSGRSGALPSVAVLDVRNASGNESDAWVSTALAETLTENLSANEGLKAVSTEQVAQWRRDSVPGAIRRQIEQRGPELEDRLGTHYAVVADFRITSGGSDPSLQVDTRLQRLRDGKMMLRASDRGSETQLYALTAQIARKIRLALGAPQGDLGVPRGPDKDSMRLYSEAVVKLRDSDPLAARILLEKSAGADPSNFLARSLLAETYFSLGMEAQAKIEAQAALRLAPPLAPLEKLALEARCQGAMGDYPAAVVSYQKLWRASPEVAEYGLYVAEYREKSGRCADALQTLQTLRKTRLSAAEEARVDFAESGVLPNLGDNRDALARARHCEGIAQRIGARSLYARARLREGGLMMNLVAPNSLAALDDGLAVCRAIGDRSCELNGLRQEGNLFAPVNPERGMELYRQGAAIARQLGNRRGLVELLRGMAFVAERQMQDNEAEQRDHEIIQVVQEDRLSDKSSTQIDLSELLVSEGRLDEADRYLHQMDRALTQSLSWNLCMGEIERSRGDFDRAAPRVEAAVEQMRKSDDRYALTLALAEASQVHRVQGNFRRAEAEADEIDKIRPFDPISPYLRAEVALARGQWDRAEGQTRAAVGRQQEVNRPLEAAISIVRAEALTGSGHAAEALRVLDQMDPRLNRSRREPLKIRARLCRLKAQTLAGSRPAGPAYRDVLAAAQRPSRR